MARTKVYFASDMHFGSYFHSDPMAVERKFVRWLEQIKCDAKAIVLVGDIFDYWFEYKHVVPRGYTRVIGTLAKMADEGVEVILFTGNHDIWSFGYLEQEIGCQLYRTPQELFFDDKHFFIAHGDEFIRDDKGYRFMQSIFRNRFCQVLYAALHPWWTVGFAHRWALSSRKKGVQKPDYGTYKGEQEEYLITFAKSYLRERSEAEAPDFFIFGHRHIMLDLMLTHQSRLVILGDWIQYFSYAVWDGTQLTLTTFDEEQ